MSWKQISHHLANTLPPDLHDLWISPLECPRCDQEVLELRGPDRFFCSWVADHYLDRIQEAMTVHGLQQASVVFSVKDAPPLLPSAPTAPTVAPGGPLREQLCLPTVNKAPSFVRTLDPRYVFDQFVVGKSNELAHAACHALACGDQSLGQCLYISAGTGLGKSHLTHAVAHKLLAANPRLRLNYLTAQQLSNDMVRSIQNKQMDSFKDRYQGADVLLLEDMQSLTGKVKTQEELTAVLDVLLESGKSVIFTGAKPPRDIEALAPGIQSRLSCGLVTEITTPELDTRIAIVNQNAAELRLGLSEELAIVVAERIQGDIRQLKSALIGLKAKANLRRMTPDLDMINEALATSIGQRQNLTPTVIRDFVADQFRLAGEELASKSRKKTFAFPRQIAMYLSRKHTDRGLSDIGKAFNRDHSTVIHSIRTLSETMLQKTSVQGQVELLDKKLSARFLDC